MVRRSPIALCASNVWDIYTAFHPVWHQGYFEVAASLIVVRSICVSIFLVTLLKMSRGWPFWSAIGSVLFGGLMFVPGVMHWMSDANWWRVIFLAWIPNNMAA